MNEKIKTAREHALDILKPSARDLEYGMELHTDALVVEPYCLGLRAPFDPAPLNEIIDRKGTRDAVVDLYSEMSVLGWARTPELRQEYREAWEASGVDATFQNAGEEGNDPLRLLKRFSNYNYLTEVMPEFLRKVVTPDDILEAKSSGRRSIGIACNGVPLPGDCSTVEEELYLIRIFAKLGMRIAHLTYNRRNPLGDGCGERANGGLSDFGRHAIHELHRCGVMVDIAHTGWQTCLDAIAEADRPLVVSHSTACSIHETIRGKPDNVIKALVDKGGVIGITNVPGFLGRTQDIAAMLDHLDYVIGKFGADAVCIGTDAGYVAPAAANTDSKLKPMAPVQQRWESLWPDGGFARINDERATQSLMWTNWPLFTVGLVQRGHSEETIRKVLGQNIMRVFREVWDRSELKF